MSPQSRYNGVAMPVLQGVKSKLGDCYRLTQDFRVSVAVDERIYTIDVYAGFVTDGASIPRFLWRVCGHPYEVPRVAAALAHDWLYRSQVVDRETADRIFRAICKKVGIGWLKRNAEYYALRWFGGSAWEDNTPKVDTARTYGAISVATMEGES